MRIERMLAITIMLLNRDRISAKEFSQKFAVSVRTVYRDIEAINLAGIPVISYQGNDGGFGIMENYRIDRQVLTLPDMFTILTALKGVNTGIENIGIESVFEKIKNLVPKNKSGEMEKHFGSIAIDLMPWGFREREKTTFRTIQDSISRNLLLKIRYDSSKGETSERTIEPMTLLLMGYSWYLFAFCRLRENFRLFRLSRIREAEIMNESFSRREATYRDYVSHEQQGDSMVHLILKFSPEAKTRVLDYIREEQIEIQDDGSMIVKISYPEDEWVYSNILSYGEHVEVLSPPHIRKIIQEKTKKILSKYKPDITVSQE
jgi:predicted DNA-binding transcriptional regulator YafY